MKKLYKLIFSALAILIAAGFIGLEIYVIDRNSTYYSVEQDYSRPFPYKCEFYLNFEVSKSWLEGDGVIGGQYDISFINDSSQKLKDWKLVFDVPEGTKIDSSWNGVFTLDEEANTVTVTPLDYNLEVKPDSTETLGCVMYTPSRFEVVHSKLYVHKEFSRSDFALFKLLIVFAGIYLVCLLINICVSISAASYRRKQEHDRKIIVQSLKTFANFIDVKDRYTNGHSLRVAAYAGEIARRMKNKDVDPDNIYYMALLHDVGKIAISDDILNKPGALSPEERKIIETHTVKGGQILKDFTALPEICDGAMYHHERFDGSGYPTGLAGTDIPLCARIICVADSYDAMASDRCYRKRLPKDVIVSEFKRCGGTQFDPELIPFILDMIEDGTAERIEAENNN